ncbi:MAG TPA: LUD domain-containing protein [Bacteroidia bacterium]|nr:LUD domain-containing protein [Bacteroidia bacterium]
MQESTSREKILKKIRAALISKSANPYPHLDFDKQIFRMNDDVPELIFARNFRDAGGNFVFCSDILEFAENLLTLAQLKSLQGIVCVENSIAGFLEQCEFPVHRDTSLVSSSQAAVTLCESLVARTGSILVSSGQASGRLLPSFVPVHIVVAFTNQLVDDIQDGLQLLKKKYGDKQPSSFTFITGPSRTADIGNELVKGAQGPGELYLFLIDKSPNW